MYIIYCWRWDHTESGWEAEAQTDQFNGNLIASECQWIVPGTVQS